LAAMGIGIAGPAFADAKGVDAAIAKITGGKAAGSGKITMDVPQIAENGSTVPITVSVDSPMTDASHVKTLHVWADGNPSPEVASFHFTPMSGKAYVSTRIRLAKTQNVVTLAEMSDGSFAMGKAEVKVTIGGCGG
jgi:sulfur-oxidizing protein SoxY